MKPRKKYKALFQAEEHRRQIAEAERDAYKRELREYQEALAPYGQKTMEAELPSPSYEPIALKPMEFVAVKAFMEMNSRIERYVTGEIRVPLSYSWRGRPIHRV